MRSVVSFLAIAMMAIVMVSCNGKKKQEEIVVKPETTQISGELGKCFSIVDREYKATGDVWRLVTIEVERLDEELPFDLDGRELWSYSQSGRSANVQVGFGIEFLDADGNVLDKVSANRGGMGGPYSSDECVELVKLKPGEKGTIRYQITSDAKTAVRFRMTSSFDEHEEKQGGSSSNASSNAVRPSLKSSSSSSSNGHNWDAVLDSYEKYVDEYIALVKKMAKGDMSAMTQYPSMMEKAQNVGEELSKANGHLTAAQQARYLKILNKMTKAMSEIQK